jgi:hypothetical protein
MTGMAFSTRTRLFVCSKAAGKILFHGDILLAEEEPGIYYWQRRNQGYQKSRGLAVKGRVDL